MAPKFPAIVQKYWNVLAASFVLFVLVGPFMDYYGKVALQLGRINNLSVLTTIFFIPFLIPAVTMMKGAKEQRLMTFIVAWLLYAYIGVATMKLGGILSLTMLFTLTGAIGAGLSTYLLARQGNRADRTLLGMILAQGFLLPIPILMIWTWPDRFDSFMLNVYGYNNVRGFGYFCAVTIAALGGSLAIGATGEYLLRWRNLILLGAMSLTWAMLCWGGGRAGVVALAVGLPVALWFMGRLNWREIALNVATAAIGAILSLFIYTPGGGAFGMITRYHKTVQGLEHGGVNGLSANRTDLWIWAWHKILERPLTGYGYLPMHDLRTYRFNYYHVHNLVLEYLLDFGLPIGLLVLGVMFYICFRAGRAAGSVGGGAMGGLLAVAAILPVYAMFSATLFFPFHLMIFLMCLGAVLGRKACGDLASKEGSAYEQAKAALTSAERSDVFV